MGEAIMVKYGGGGGDSLASESTPLNAYILTSGYYVAPKSGNYYVTCVGGGGCGGSYGGGTVVSNPAWSTNAYSYESNRTYSYSSGANLKYVNNSTFMIYINNSYAGPYAPGGGGGSGYFNSATIYLNAGQTIDVGIGAGSSTGTGGTTSFGTYLAANGGKSGSTPYCWTSGTISDDDYGWIREQGWIGGNGGAGGASGMNGNAGAMGSKTSGGKLYFNNSGGQSAVSSSSTSYGVLSYGDGGYGGYVVDVQISSYNRAITSVNLAQAGSGNNGICIVRYAD